MNDKKKEENTSIAMDEYDSRPSAWFRDSFGSLGKYGKISKDQFVRASVDIGVGVIWKFLRCTVQCRGALEDVPFLPIHENTEKRWLFQGISSCDLRALPKWFSPSVNIKYIHKV